MKKYVSALLFCVVGVAIHGQGGRGNAPPRPNMLDDADVTLKPPFSMSPDLSPNPNAPQGRIHRFTMKSEDSKIYKGISRDKPGEVRCLRAIGRGLYSRTVHRRDSRTVHRRAGWLQPEVSLLGSHRTRQPDPPEKSAGRARGARPPRWRGRPRQ